MKIRMILAHPLGDSLSAHLAARIGAVLSASGHAPETFDLYAQGFDPRLTGAERAGYYTSPAVDRDGLSEVEMLILVFPTWWFGLPAILKGWIDRSFLPGVAYDHDPDLGRMIPRLTRLRHVLVVTTLGSPAWIDRLVMWRPVARVLRWGVIRPCAPQARLTYLPLYGAEAVAPARLARFEDRLARVLGRLTGKSA